MLHIHNGDSAAGTARNAGLPGVHLAWREALVCGPAPAGLFDDEFRRVRAEHLASAYGQNLEDCIQDLRKQEEALERFADHEEVVLWFEHDLFCQVQLIYLLNWLARQDIGKTRLSLISIYEFGGIDDFRGLGQLNESQLASLFPQRKEMTTAQLNLGRRAWAAYTSSDPSDLLALLKSDTTALPFLREALLKHLQRFPSARNGLGRIEDLALELVASGHHEFGTLFSAFGKTEPVYGYGDLQFYLELKALADAPHPLVTIDDADGKPSANKVTKTSLQVSQIGRSVLRGEKDFVRMNGIDKWLGGVHLTGIESAWRWDESDENLISDRL